MKFRFVLVCLIQVLFALTSLAQSEFADTTKLQKEECVDLSEEDSLQTIAVDSAFYENYSEERILIADVDSVSWEKPVFKPNPTRSVWLAAIFPGLGKQRFQLFQSLDFLQLLLADRSFS